jgi:hypothetical protein
MTKAAIDGRAKDTTPNPILSAQAGPFARSPIRLEALEYLIKNLNLTDKKPE